MKDNHSTQCTGFIWKCWSMPLCSAEYLNLVRDDELKVQCAFRFLREVPVPLYNILMCID